MRRMGSDPLRLRLSDSSVMHGFPWIALAADFIRRDSDHN